MALTLTTNPVGAGASKIFAGLSSEGIKFIFKREDLTITSVVSGTGGVKINHAGDLSSYLSAGDTIYLYSAGTGFTYDTTGTILTVVAGEITIDVDYVVSGTGGYINYLKNYYVELQCVRDTLPDANVLSFSLQSDGDAAGNIEIDVSTVCDLLIQRGAIAQAVQTASKIEFEVKYREVHTGSSNVFTLVDGKLLIVLYCKSAPNEDAILNRFETPKIYLGYSAGIALARKAGATSSTIEMLYKELDANKQSIASGTLSTLAGDVSGFLLWKWLNTASVNAQTKYIEFETKTTATFDFNPAVFEYPDFLTQ